MVFRDELRLDDWVLSVVCHRQFCRSLEGLQGASWGWCRQWGGPGPVRRTPTLALRAPPKVICCWKIAALRECIYIILCAVSPFYTFYVLFIIYFSCTLYTTLVLATRIFCSFWRENVFSPHKTNLHGTSGSVPIQIQLN